MGGVRLPGAAYVPEIILEYTLAYQYLGGPLNTSTEKRQVTYSLL